MAKNLLIFPVFRAHDSGGVPLAGGNLYAYEAGTTTPLATYTTSDGSVANSHPVTLDGNGEARVWLTPGVNYKFVLENSGGNVQWTVDNYPSAAEQAESTDTATVEPGGRLTLTSATPVTTSDVTGATTIHYAPYKHDKVPLYDGTSWALYSIDSGLSQTTTDTTKSPAAVTTNSNYDLFVWNDAGTIRLSRGPLWSSSTTRGSGAGTTAIERINGRWVNSVAITNGPLGRRGLYVGTVRSDGSSQINDSLAKRHVWNMHNRVLRAMEVRESTDNWAYTTATFRQANGNTANQLDFVRGLDEDAVHARVMASADNASSVDLFVGIGLDSTTTVSGLNHNQSTNATDNIPLDAAWSGLPGLGRHFLAWLEYSQAAGTTTWQGDAGAGAFVRSGIQGECWA